MAWGELVTHGVSKLVLLTSCRAGLTDMGSLVEWNNGAVRRVGGLRHVFSSGFSTDRYSKVDG